MLNELIDSLSVRELLTEKIQAIKALFNCLFQAITKIRIFQDQFYYGCPKQAQLKLMLQRITYLIKV